MDFEKVSWEEVVTEALHTIRSVGGLLLGTREQDTGRANIMTIGWVLFGIVWGKPIATVLVRPSRFTYFLLEGHPFFTINVPPPHLSQAVVDCGKYSGRNVDKFTHCALTPVYFEDFPVPSIEECIASLQCTVVAKTSVVPEKLAIPIRETYYSGNDYHTVYFGEIQATWKRRNL